MKKAVLFLLCSLLLLFVGNLLFGSVSIPPSQVWAIITGGEAEKDSCRFIVLESRLPQAVTARERPSIKTARFIFFIVCYTSTEYHFCAAAQDQPRLHHQ